MATSVAVQMSTTGRIPINFNKNKIKIANENEAKVMDFKQNDECVLGWVLLLARTTQPVQSRVRTSFGREDGSCGSFRTRLCGHENANRGS